LRKTRRTVYANTVILDEAGVKNLGIETMKADDAV